MSISHAAARNWRKQNPSAPYLHSTRVRRWMRRNQPTLNNTPLLDWLMGRKR